MDENTFMNGIAMGQITPGPVVITATFVGYMLYEILGGIIATISVFAPSFLIVTDIEPYFNIIRKSFYINKALKGILFSLTGLLLITRVSFTINIPWDWTRILFVAAAFISLLYKLKYTG
jgi:chromate transporter